MGMTIDMAIAIIENPTDYFPKDIEEVKHFMIDTLRKYQKIIKILNSASYTENGTVYSYTYDEDTRVRHIREVIEDGKIN